jgi:hypothetical protein
MVLKGNTTMPFLTGFRQASHYLSMIVGFGDYFTESIPEDADNKITREAYKKSGLVRLYRRFITTNKGYLGWAPSWQYVDADSLLRKGDSICIIFGCSYSLIIGKRNSE